MITKLDQNTAQDIRAKYENLFDAAFEDLKKSTKPNGDPYLSQAELDNDGFRDIAEYYAHAEDFLYIGKPQYLLLPLDEKHFEINANTRGIAVPIEFQNCSGVVKDNMAEVITFTIDRYFDFMDLASLNIDVYWIAPGENGTKRYGVDVIDPNLIDLETFKDEGLLRFGWPLSEELTMYPGNIEFSVRFYYIKDGKETYALNTLPNIIPIKNSLTINKDAEEGVTVIRNQSSLFRNFVTNYNGPATGLPTPVSFTILDLKREDKITPNDDLELLVCAYTVDKNNLDYKWYKALDPESGVKTVIINDTDFELDIDDKTITYSQAVPRIDSDLITLIDTNEIDVDLESEACRSALNGAYISYDDNVYKCSIVEKSGRYIVLGNKAIITSNVNRQLIDFDDKEGPYANYDKYVAVTLTDEQKAKRPSNLYYVQEGGAYRRYKANEEWPPAPAVTLYEKYNCLYFKPRSEAVESRKEEYNNITGRYFATATNTKGNDEAVGESTAVKIWEPADITITKDFSDYVFIQETLEADGTTTYAPVVLEMNISHDEHNPTLTQTCKYTNTKDIKDVPSSLGNITDENTRVEMNTSSEAVKITTTNPGYYQISTTANLNRKDKFANSKICAVYNMPTAPSVKKCNYFVGEANSTIVDKQTITWNDEWSATGDSYITVDAPYRSFIYLFVEPADAFINNFSTRDVTYTWYAQFEDEEEFEITSAHVGDGMLLSRTILVDGKEEAQNPNSNYIVIDWDLPNNSTKTLSVRCKITNTVEDKFSDMTTQSIVFK